MKKVIALLLAFLLACTCLAGCGTKALTHAEYENAALDSEVTIETYVQATQSWWEDKITAYCQSEDGAYFLYNMACAEADAAKLVPGTKIKVTGFKSEWSGEVEITDAKFKIVKGDNFIAQPFDVTELLGTDDLIRHQNEKVSFTGLTVEPANDEGAAFLYNWDGSGEDGNDLYFYLSKDGQTYSFTVESYLCGAGTEVYEAVKNLSVGDKVDLEGFLYWYEESQPHVTSLTVTEKAPALDKDVVVLFTNDVHCGVAEEGAVGYSGLAAYKKSIEADNYVLLADVGDFAQGGPIGTFSQGKYLVDIMNYIGYDVATPGNHEFDYGLDNFFKIVEKAEFPFVSANFTDLNNNALALDAYKMFDFNGIKIAFVGISTPQTLVTSTPTYFQNDAGEFVYSFCQNSDGSGVYAAVQAAVDAARAEGAKYVIAIGHLGDELSCSPWTAGEVINNTTGIDVFIDGHSHSVIDESDVKNAAGENVLWAQTGTKLNSFGKLVISKDGTLNIDLISDYTEKDADTDAFIANIESNYEEDLATVVGHTDFDLEINMPGTDPAVRIVRCMETNLADLVTDAYRTVGEADICITNAGGIRATIPAGDITYNNILTTSPFGNTVCVIEATGQQIVDALEMGARSVPDEVGGFLQVSGLSYEIHSYLPSGVQLDESEMFTGIEGDVRRVQNVLVNGEPIDLEKTYTVAGLDYIFLNCGDGYTMFKDCTVVRDMQMTDNQLITDYLVNYLNGVIPEEYSDVFGQNRIVIINEEPAPALDKDVVVLFTNDVHCGVAEEDHLGYANLAAYKKSLEADNYVLLADAGDVVQGGPIGTFSKGGYLIDIMNFLGYDIATPGNHEFDFGIENFFDIIERADYPYISANLTDLNNNALVLDAYKIFDFNGVKIAFVGISTPDTLVSTNPAYLQNDAGEFIYSFCQNSDGSGVYAAVQAAADAARAEGAQYVIALGHLGDDLDSSPYTAGEVINNTTGIDAFIDGHSHSIIDGEIVKNADGKNVLWTQTGTRFNAIGKLVIGADGKLSMGLIKECPETDADTEAFIADIQTSYEADLATVVGHTDYDLEINMPDTDPVVRIVRRMETNLADLIADAYRTVGGADICMINGGAVRATIPAGDITAKNIITTLPFSNTVCVIEATGQQIVDALEMGARSVPAEDSGLMQASGLTYEIHSYLPSGVQLDETGMFTGVEGDVRRVKNVLVHGEPIDLEKTYTVVGLDYIFVNCGNGFTMFKDCPIVRDMQAVDNQVFTDYLVNYLNGVIPEEYSDIFGQDRIVIINEAPAAAEESVVEEIAEVVVEETPAAK